MRYDDASQAGSTASDSAPVARPDVDTLSPGSFGPASGNAITGAGTVTGASGADTPGTIVEVHGAGGPTAGTAGDFQAVGQFGMLNMDAEGNFSYVRNAGTPDGVQDVFGYTLADAKGATSATTLTIDIGKDQAQTAITIPGVVNLPPGVELSDIHVQGRDLVITLPDGSHMTIPGGAVFVPQLVIGDVQVPPSNLAALLVESEPQPAAGQLQSSGGNFATDVPPLDPGVPLGDLIPPTELVFTPPEFEEIGQFVDTEPTIDVQPDGQPASVAAVDEVFEAGLPARGSEPEGSGEEAAAGDNGDPSEATSGVIHFTAEDGLDSITINGEAITAVGQVIDGAQGTLTITSIDLANGAIGYSYLLTDNTNPGGDGITDPFTVTVTDSDGDTATATLTINIHDDAPDARNDTDALVGQEASTDGNVMTGVGTTSGSSGHDTTGADDATVTGAHQGGGSGSFTSVPQDGSGVVIHGLFGDLVLHDDGSYVYTRNEEALEGGTEVFTYQLTDGDGDVDTATLTITVPNIDLTPSAITPEPVFLDDDALPGGIPGGVGDQDPDTVNDTGFLQGTGGNGDLDFFFSAEGDQTGLPTGFTANLVDSSHLEISQNGTHVLTVTLDNETGAYTVTQVAPLTHPDGLDENDIGDINVSFFVQDADGDHSTPAFLTINVDDDTPDASVADVSLPTITLDESVVGTDTSDGSLPNGIATDTVDFSGVFNPPAFGADGAGSVDYTLLLTPSGGSPIGSGLFALDNTDTTLADLDGIGQGDEILLVQTDAHTITGSVNGTDYFTIEVDSDGNVTFTQLANIWHPDTDNNDDPQSIVPNNGTLEIVQAVTDADNDTDTASVDLSGAFTIQDDGPDAVADAEPDLPQLIVDESPLPTDGDGINSASANFATAFAAVLDFGTDGPGSAHYALILNGDEEAGIASGLFALDASDTETVIDPLGQGAEIQLIQNPDGSISGVVGTDVYFTISVDADTGEVTLERDPNAAGLNLWHDNTGNPDDQEILTAAANTIQLQQTLTDADGDHDSAVVDLSAGVFVFEDDGPDADTSGGNPPTITLDESAVGTDTDGGALPVGIASDSADFSTLFAAPPNFGTDGPGSALYTLLVTPDSQGGTVGSGLFALDNTDTETVIDGYGQGDEILLVQTDSDTISGIVNGTTYFTIDVNQATGEVTFTQINNIWHDDTSNPDDPETLTANGGTLEIVQTVTDADGDTDTASADISGAFVIQDDGPVTFVPDSTEVENDTGSVLGVSLDTDDGDLSNNFGTDGPGTVRFPSSLEGTSSGLTSNLAPIIYHVSADGQSLIGYVDDGTTEGFQSGEDDTIFTITLHPGSSTYDIVMDGHVDASTTIQFNEAGFTFVGGNDPWSGFTLPAVGSQDLLITPMVNGVSDGTTNTSDISGGVGAGNSVGLNEAVRLDYVIDLAGNPNKAGGSDDYGDVINQDHTFDGHYITNGAFASFSATSPGTSTILIKAFDDFNSADSNNSGTDGNDVVGDGDLDVITAITLSFAGGPALLVDHDGTFTVNQGTANERSYTVDFEADGTVTVEDVFGTGGSNASETTIAVFTGDGYSSLEFHYVSGEEFKIGNFGAAVESTDPVPVSVPVEIVDADGDVTAGSNIDFSIVPEGSLSLLSTLSTTSSLSESSFDTSSLFANDNDGHGKGHDNGRAFNAGSNSVLMGALAAAGLESDAAAAGSSHDNGHDKGGSDTVDTSVVTSQSVTSESDSSSSSESSDSQLGDTNNQPQDAPQQSSQSNDNDSGHDKGVSNEQADAHAPADLPQGTDAPSQEGDSTPVTAAAIVMASADDLAGQPDGHSVGNSAQHNEVVGKVLADALHGGGGEGPNIESLINSLPGHEGGHGDHGHQAALDALASHGAGAVPNGDTGIFAGFSGGHGMHMMEQMAMHQDAAPAHA